MEFVERLAYYGVRMLLSIYIVGAVSAGGLEFTHIQKGQIYASWALIQSILPIVFGSLSDYFGHRKTIFAAICIKVIGYLLMATQTSFFGFWAGCMLLASGTALFKPAVQGLLVSSLNTKNSSIGWGIFYWLINLGGFLGPWLAGFLRLVDWSWVFFGNALIVSLNFLLLFFLKPAENQLTDNTKKTLSELLKLPIITFKEMFKPSLISFLLVYSGFWMMYNQIFDLLPNFIDDWINSAPLLLQIGELFHNANWIELAKAGKQIPTEWLISINCGTILLLMIPFSFFFKRIDLITSMIIGILVVLIGMFLFGFSQSALICIIGIIIFSIGEMGASPRMREYLGLISPKGKEGQYMGYANLPEAIGWGFGSLVAGYWYQVHSDKHSLALKYLTEKLNWSAQSASELPKDQILITLSKALHLNSFELSQFLWLAYSPQKIWYWFIMIGFLTVIGLLFHQKYFKKKEAAN